MEKLKNGQRGMALLTQRLKGKDKGELLGAAFVLLEGILLPNAVVLQGMAPFGIAYVSCFFMQRWKTPMFLSAGLSAGHGQGGSAQILDLLGAYLYVHPGL